MVTVTLSPSAAGVRARRTVLAAAAAAAQVPVAAQQQRRGGCAGLSGAGCFAAQAEKRAPIRAVPVCWEGGCAPRLGGRWLGGMREVVERLKLDCCAEEGRGDSRENWRTLHGD